MLRESDLASSSLYKALKYSRKEFGRLFRKLNVAVDSLILKLEGTIAKTHARSASRFILQVSVKCHGIKQDAYMRLLAHGTKKTEPATQKRYLGLRSTEHVFQEDTFA